MRGVALDQSGLGPVSRKSRIFSHPESRNKPHLMNTELAVYSYILAMKRGSLHTKRFRRIHVSVFRHRLIKNYFASPKCFRDVRETGPSRGEVVWKIAIETTSSVRSFA